MQAAKEGVRYPHHMLLTFAWYPSGWWKGTEEEDIELGCSQAQREAVLKDTLSVWRLSFLTDFTGRPPAESGIVSSPTASFDP